MLFGTPSGASSRSLAQLRAARERGKLPHVTDARVELIPSLAPDETALTRLPWTGGFVAGQLWLASRVSENRQLAAEAAAVTDFLAPRAAQPDTHDLGFLFWPSAVLGHLVTGDSKHRELALRAARSLTKRVLPAGVIQVIGALDDPDQRGRTIVDTLPNLTLLWWAEHEGIARAGEVARSHVAASLRACIREDGSTFPPSDLQTTADRGAGHGQRPGAGFYLGAGQAWTICGLVSATERPATARSWPRRSEPRSFFCDRLPPGRIPTWDFDAAPGAPTDSSAAAIVASALLDLDGEWRDRGLELLRALVTRCLNRGKRTGCSFTAATATPWARGRLRNRLGDFFLLDALVHAVRPEAQLDPLADGG